MTITDPMPDTRPDPTPPPNPADPPITPAAFPRRDLPLKSLTLAADARLSRVDYTDDQIWELLPGAGESLALVVQTRYGGRVGLASLVPMWHFPDERRIITEAQGYATPPQITAFAPGYARVEAALLPHLTLVAEYWALESHALGVHYTLHHTGTAPINLRLELFGQVGVRGQSLPLAVASLVTGGVALVLGRLTRLTPVVLLENANALPGISKTTSPKIGTDLTLAPGATHTLKWVHAGEADLRDSLALADAWLKADWTKPLARVAQAAQALPVIETGDAALDQAIALSYQLLLDAVMKGDSLPHPSLLATRQPADGFSPNGIGTDYNRAWNGQPVPLVYLAALPLATIDPHLAQGLVLNFLVVQDPDGAIDSKPGLAGQRQGMLAVPLLARLTLELYRLTGDVEFVRAALPALNKFYLRWQQEDTDQDGFPEWADERQTGYPYFPTFAKGQTWAQNAEIQYAETPDLLAYLASEALSLRDLVNALGDPERTEIAVHQLTHWLERLDTLWQEGGSSGGYFAPRDRDTHQVAGQGVSLLENGRADEVQQLDATLTPPARLLIRITGGTDRAPKLKLTIHGTNPDGNAINETFEGAQVGWYRGYGVVVSQRVYGFVQRVTVEGLSRVYKLSIRTVDLSRRDLTGVLPLWSRALTAERAAALLPTITDPQGFWRPNGVAMTPATDPNFDPSNAQGGGGVWLFWLTLIGEGLLHAGDAAAARDLFQRITGAQTTVLLREGQFYEFYHSDEPQGSGDVDHLAGIIPLHLLNRLIGAVILSPATVRLTGAYALDRSITIRQHGVTLIRSSTGTQISFPTGHTVELPADAPAQIIDDPQPAPAVPAAPIERPEVAAGVADVAGEGGKVVIQVDTGAEAAEPPVAEIKPDSDETA